MAGQPRDSTQIVSLDRHCVMSLPSLQIACSRDDRFVMRRVLVSALACSARRGSEAAIGYHIASALAKRYSLTVITSGGMDALPAVTTHTIPVRFQDPNDVSPSELLDFEKQQRRLVARLQKDERFDLVHRLTPSGLKDTLLPSIDCPVVVGPILLSDPPPAAFDEILHPLKSPWWPPSAFGQRVLNRRARLTFEREGTIGRLLSEATAIFVGSRVTLNRLPHEQRRRATLVTYAGVDHERFRPPAARRGNGVLQLLFVGRRVPYKGLALLLRSVQLVSRQRDVNLLVVGGGSSRYDDYYHRLAAHLGIADVVRFVPNAPRSDIIGFYQAADLFCMPSIETYGVAILEAMSCECVPVVADINGPGEIVRDGTGLRIPYVTPLQFVQDYAAAMIRLDEDRGYMTALAKQARLHVQQHHDWAVILDSFVTTYARITREA